MTIPPPHPGRGLPATAMALAIAIAVAALPAAAQQRPPGPAMEGVAEALRGAWYAGPSCAAPEAALVVTARAVARLPADGPAQLLRFVEMRRDAAAGWTIGTARGPEAPRLMLRAAAGAEALETIEPDAKTRDDRLPGDAPVEQWTRCPAAPPAIAALHGEGVAVLAALEQLEAACGAEDGTGRGATAGSCAAAIVAAADVSGDGLLAPAEIARLVRGAAWVVAAEDGDASPDAMAAVLGAGGLAGIAAARLLVESLDYDGDGRISPAELAQDRTAFASAGGTAAGRPLRTDAVGEGAGLLRGLFEAFLGGGGTDEDASP